LKDATAAEPPSEQTVRSINRVAGVSRGHIKPVETSRANRKVRKTHPGEGPNGATQLQDGIRFFRPPLPTCLSAFLADRFPYLNGDNWAYHVPLILHDGLVSACLPGE